MRQNARGKHDFTPGAVKGRGSGSVDVAWLTEMEVMVEDNHFIEMSIEFIWVWCKRTLLSNRDQHMYYMMTERLQLRLFGENYEWIYTLHKNACAVISVGIHVKMAATRVKNCIIQFIAVRVPVP